MVATTMGGGWQGLMVMVAIDGGQKKDEESGDAFEMGH